MPEKVKFLTLYDYGQGGVWNYVIAGSREDIGARFPQLVIYDDPPEWMSEEDRLRIEQTSSYDLDTAASQSDFLRRLVIRPEDIKS